MTLLRDIQATASDDKVNLSVLLRKCKVLAARLGNMAFKQWVENELNGYDDSENLPDYRILTVTSQGNFISPTGEKLTNIDISMENLPEHLRGGLGHLFLHQSANAMQTLLENDEDNTAREIWSPAIVTSLGGDIYQGFVCLQAWKVIPISSIIAALDTIRSKILNFALEVEAEAPDAGEAPTNTNPVPQNKLHDIFNRYIMCEKSL